MMEATTLLWKSCADEMLLLSGGSWACFKFMNEKAIFVYENKGYKDL